MRVAFRVDASLEIGTGHVMRCLALAAALRDRGADCLFIGRAHSGHLADLISSHGFGVVVLAVAEEGLDVTRAPSLRPTEQTAHAHWLGCDWRSDAVATQAALQDRQPDWLVVDHYALNDRWEIALQHPGRKIMVIDDLADRAHRCDLLVDPGIGRHRRDYAAWVPNHCEVLAGPAHALLRPEFSALRPYSLRRREKPSLKKLLVTMGGVDRPNATGRTLQALKAIGLPPGASIQVIVGLHAPWKSELQQLAATMSCPTEIIVHSDRIAQVMADSDLAIGAAGGTALERCCVGLPSIVLVLAENQRQGAQALHSAGAALLIGEAGDPIGELASAFESLAIPDRLRQMSEAARNLVDGLGIARVLQSMERMNA